MSSILNYKASDLLKYIGSGSSLLVVVVLLLIASNVFMSFAWYHHLKNPSMPFITALGISLIYVIFEYTCNIHANELGYSRYSLYTLKIMQEAITLCVFMAFAFYIFDEKPTYKHLASFGLILGATALAF